MRIVRMQCSVRSLNVAALEECAIAHRVNGMSIAPVLMRRNSEGALGVFHAAFFGLCMTLCPVAWAQDQRQVEEGAESAYQMAQTFAECAGYWDWWSAVEEVSGNTASSENAHNIGNGTRLAAGYMLSMRHRLVSPNEAPRAYGAWDSFIEPIAEATFTRMSALLEQEDGDGIAATARDCVAAGEAVSTIVEQIRRDTLDAR